MYEKLLKRLQQIQAKKGLHVEPPCPVEKIRRLQAECAKRFGNPLPPGYASFLSLSNGLDFNGFVLYGQKRRQRSEKARFLEGFIEANKDGRESFPEAESYLVIGDSDLDEYGWSIEREQYEILEKELSK
jgi:hypothetical protein